ncbi:MAG: response regulator transcription factor [Lachnospiraceae bacterium]
MRILIVEDEKHLAFALKEILESQKYMADIANNGLDGLSMAQTGSYDLIILDVMLPYKNGFEIITQLRQEKLSTPIILLTAKDSVEDKVFGLDRGADDYMTKPFSPEELLARIRVLSRRQGEVILDELNYKDITFCFSTSELRCKDKSVRLNYKETEILKLLMTHPEIILSKEELIIKVWGYDSNAGDSNVEAYISFLRRKLHFVGSQTEIVSVKKMGYHLC